MDLIEKARELGIAMAASSECIRMKEAQAALLDNEEASSLLDELKTKRERLVSILEGDDPNTFEALALTDDVTRLQEQLQENPLIVELMASEAAFTVLARAVYAELNVCIGPARGSCDGDCDSCDGCAH